MTIDEPEDNGLPDWAILLPEELWPALFIALTIVRIAVRVLLG